MGETDVLFEFRCTEEISYRWQVFSPHILTRCHGVRWIQGSRGVGARASHFSSSTSVPPDQMPGAFLTVAEAASSRAAVTTGAFQHLLCLPNNTVARTPVHLW
ncbi:unnamed protein product [Boreogadus saida]